MIEELIRHGFSFSNFPYYLLSQIPPLFSVHLMNCYFPDFWYSHVTERELQKGEMQYAKKQDVITHFYYRIRKNKDIIFARRLTREFE